MTTHMNEIESNILENCSKVIFGKEEAIRNILIAYLCKGHVLMEDRPGTGKTMLLRAFARTIGGNFKRIQFTPDLQPSDLTGINFYNPKTGDFQLRKGPLFTDFVLADEINRATPRTQSALLEAMGEKQISLDGETYKLGEDFMVLATQNPLESIGTFPLPDAQLDRFFMKLSLGYMNRSDEMRLMCGASSQEVLEQLVCLTDHAAIETMRAEIEQVKISDCVQNYLMDIIDATRSGRFGLHGVSVRATLDLCHASKALAALNGRTYVIPEDVKYLVPFILSHRVRSGSMLNDKIAEKKLEELLAAIPVPVEMI